MYREVKENPVEETEGDEDVALTGVANQYFGAMRDWLLKVVETNTRLVCADSHIGENLLLAQVSSVGQLRPLLHTLCAVLPKECKSSWSHLV